MPLTCDQAFKIFDTLKPDATGCINYTGVTGKLPPGYRVIINLKDGTQISASRLALERKLGYSLNGSSARHTCRNPSCINADHLYEVFAQPVA
jgi:hypothetical protein